MPLTSSGRKLSKADKDATVGRKGYGTAFWSVHDILFIDNLKKGKTISSAYYTSLLDRLTVEKKLSKMLKKKLLFHQDNALSHKSMVTMVWIEVQIASHPPYYPDQAPSEYYVLADLNRMLHLKIFALNDEVIAEINAYLKEKQIVL